MADFLDNLLDRAVGAAPVLERRRASVYEPETPRSGREEGLAQENIFAETPSRRRAESSSIGVPQSPTRRVEHREEQAALPSFRAHDESSRDMPRVEIRSVINDVPPAFPGLHRNFAVDSPIQQPIVVHNSVIERQT